MTLEVIAIVQARMGSTRLPGKVLKPIEGGTVLSHIINRLKSCNFIHHIVVATTTLEADNDIVEAAMQAGALTFRGSQNNVLERFYQAAKQHNADIIIRVTADDPLIDPTVLSEMLAYFIEHIAVNRRIDYLSNSFGKRTYPLGLDLEIFTKTALEEAYKNASQDYQKEHVTPYIYQNPNVFSLHGFYNDEDLSKYRLTLDTPEDFQVISSIYKNLFVEGKIFGMQDVISFLRQNPNLMLINEHIIQKSI